jgi:hypothetical protein
VVALVVDESGVGRDLERRSRAGQFGFRRSGRGGGPVTLRISATAAKTLLPRLF